MERKMQVTSVVNSNGLKLNVRLVMKGDLYGHENCHTHDNEEPLVEFYDSRHMHTPLLGQFISRYNLSTVLKAKDGITLEGGVPDWVIDGKALREAINSFMPIHVPITRPTVKTAHGVWRAESSVPLQMRDDGKVLMLTIGTQKRFAGIITSVARVEAISYHHGMQSAEYHPYDDYSKAIIEHHNVKIASEKNVDKCHASAMKQLLTVMTEVKNHYGLPKGVENGQAA